MSKWSRDYILLSLERVVRQTTKMQTRETEGLEEFHETQGIVRAEVSAGMGGTINAKYTPPKDNAGRDTPIAKFNITAMTIFTTVTFAAAFQVPGGYENTGLAMGALVEFSIFWMILAFYGGVQAVLEEDDPSNLAHWVTVYLVISILIPLLLIFGCTMYTVKF